MFVATKGLALATTVTGSLPRPSWFTKNLAGRPFSVALGERAYREQYFDALASQIVDQTRAGLDIVTDGDSRFDDDFAGRSWFAYVLERIGGMTEPHVSKHSTAAARDKRPGDIMYEVVETRLPPYVDGPVTRGPLEYARAWRSAQSLTTKPVKIGGISAGLVEGMTVNRHYKDRRDLIIDLSAVLNAEYHDLADAGAPVIQIEEPAIHGRVGIVDDPILTPEFYVKAFNAEVEGLRAKTEVWCHTCWGSPAAQRVEHADISYAKAIPYLNQLDVDVLTFEGAENDGMDFEVIGKGVAKDKKIAIGVVNHRTLQVERPEEVAALVRKAMKWIEPERLILSSDCGFGRQGMSRLHALYKMVSLVRGANIIRHELGLPEAEVLVANPKFALID